MSDVALSALQKRVEELTAENATLKGEAKDRRIKGRKLQEERDALAAERDGLAKDRDAWKGKAEAAPSELQARIDDLSGQLRTRDHRDAFKGVREVKATVKDKDGKDVEKTYVLNDGVPVEDVWSKAGYKPEGDAPDGTRITEHLGKALAAASWLFSEKAADAAATDPRGSRQPIQTPRATPGPGSGRGVTDTPPNALGQIDAAFGNRPAGRIA